MAVVSVSGCTGGSPTTPTPPAQPAVGSPNPQPPPTPGTAPPHSTATIVIGSNNRLDPPDVTVAVGGRVVIVNQNNRPHDIVSDPPHLHTDCPPIEEVGFIQPGQTKQTGPLTREGLCGFHDHMQENNLEFRGRIHVVRPPDS
jgi:hypothetical protein